MPIFRLPQKRLFPDPNLADPSGLLAVGGDLSPERVLLAYESGIFPWFNPGDPILWWSPDPRMILDTGQLRVGRSLKKRLRRGDYEVTVDTAFREVIEACGEVPREGQEGTWITEGMIETYCALHEQGYAHSVESWRDGELVGGLYGVMIGGLFCGESMFAKASDASKVAFVHLVRQLRQWGIPWIDCQVHTPHLERFGAREIPRQAFLAGLGALKARKIPRQKWSFDEGFDPLAD